MFIGPAFERFPVPQQRRALIFFTCRPGSLGRENRPAGLQQIAKIDKRLIFIVHSRVVLAVDGFVEHHVAQDIGGIVAGLIVRRDRLPVFFAHCGFFARKQSFQFAAFGVLVDYGGFAGRQRGAAAFRAEFVHPAVVGQMQFDSGNPREFVILPESDWSTSASSARGYSAADAHQRAVKLFDDHTWTGTPSMARKSGAKL
jgi:hypothetical protein